MLFRSRWVQQYRPEPTQLTVDSEFRATCPESVAMSKALKRKGWSFVGPTTVYAFMQAMGLVNDHAEGCVIRARAEAARKTFRRPGR